MQDLNDIYDRLGSLEAKVDILLEVRENLPGRVSALERAQSWAKGVAAGGAFLFSLMGWFIGRLFNGQ
jgi:hypothetical protein